MKSLWIISLIFTILFVSVLVTDCQTGRGKSNLAPLTRDAVATMINTSATFNKPRSAVVWLHDENSFGQVDRCHIQGLRSMGWVTVDNQLTPEGSKNVVKHCAGAECYATFSIGRRKLLGVTGVAQQEGFGGMRMAEYYWAWIPTAIGGRCDVLPEPADAYRDTAPFVLWDAGWKLAEDNYRVGGTSVPESHLPSGITKPLPWPRQMSE